MGLQYQPTPHARTKLIERAIRWWVSQLRSVFGKSLVEHQWDEIIPLSLGAAQSRTPLSGQALLCLMNDAHGYHAQLTLPKASAEAHKRALELRLTVLLPLPANELSIVFGERAANAPDEVHYDLIAFRKADLEDWDRQARELGVSRVRFVLKSVPWLQISSEGQATADRRDMVLNTAVSGLVLGALWWALTSWTQVYVEREERALLRERQARLELVERQGIRDFVGTQNTLATRLDYSDPGTLLADLNALGTALSTGSYVSEVIWSPSELRFQPQGGANAADFEGLHTWSPDARSETAVIRLTRSSEGAP